MEVNIRVLDRRELPGFRPYLLPETAAALERQDPAVAALGAVTGRSSCGAVAVRQRPDGMMDVTDLFVDAAVRRQGVGGQLLDALLQWVDTPGLGGLAADFVLREDELTAMEGLLASRGFYPAGTRSQVFAVPSSQFHVDQRLGHCFTPGYRTPPGVVPLAEAPEAALTELEETEDLPDYLRWSRLREKILPDLSVVLLREGRAEAYLLAGENELDGYILRAAASRRGAPPTAFLSLLKELLNRCYY